MPSWVASSGSAPAWSSLCVSHLSIPPTHPPSPECPQILPVSPPQPLLQPAPPRCKASPPPHPPPSKTGWVHTLLPFALHFASLPSGLSHLYLLHIASRQCSLQKHQDHFFSGDTLSPGSIGLAFPKPCRPCALSQGIPSLSADVLVLIRGVRGGPCLLHC